MAEIEIGDIVITATETNYVFDWENVRFETGKSEGDVRATFRAISESGEMTANFGLMMEYHPELGAHCDAIREYMKQEARRLLGE
jgi:hypothetical protein